jgi:AcrR family transcriptional regulator
MAKTSTSAAKARAMKSSKGRKPKPQDVPQRGRPGGAESRARIVEAAGQLFAARGFDGVSTRELARAAKINISAITYYFGGKSGLYRAVLEQLIEDTAPLFEPMVTGLEAGVAAAGTDRQALAELMAGFLSGLLNSILSDPKIRWQMPLVLREFQQPSDGFRLLYENRIFPIHNVVSQIVGAAKGIDPNATETKLITATIVGQCMGFGFARPVIFARTGWNEYSEANRRIVIETVTAGILDMLGLPNKQMRLGRK